MNTLRNLFIQLHCTANLLPLAIFLQKKFLFELNPSMFFKAPIFWTFWSFLLVQLHFTASLPHSAILKKIQKIFEKPIYYFWTKNLNFLRFPEILLLQLHSTANLLPLAIFKKLKIFFEKPIFFEREAKFRTFCDVLLYQLHSTVTLLPLAIF